jgi:hypothetical protein
MNLAKHVAGMGPGSARVSRVGLGVSPKQSFLWMSPVLGAKKPQEKFAIARMQSPARETRALPRAFARDLIVHA